MSTKKKIKEKCHNRHCSRIAQKQMCGSHTKKERKRWGSPHEERWSVVFDNSYDKRELGKLCKIERGYNHLAKFCYRKKEKKFSIS